MHAWTRTVVMLIRLADPGKMANHPKMACKMCCGHFRWPWSLSDCETATNSFLPSVATPSHVGIPWNDPDHPMLQALPQVILPWSGLIVEKLTYYPVLPDHQLWVKPNNDNGTVPTRLPALPRFRNHCWWVRHSYPFCSCPDIILKTTMFSSAMSAEPGQAFGLELPPYG